MKLLFSFLSLLAVTLCQAQTADEIVQKYSDAMGGLDAFKKVQTAKITGNLNVQGMDLPLTVQIINGRAFRTDVDAMGQAVTSSFKDGKGWTLNPFSGIETPTDVEGSDLVDYKSQSNLASSLMDYKALGHAIELLGQEMVEGVNTYKIKLTAKEDGRVTHYYISAKEFLPIKVSSQKVMQGNEMEVETWFSNLKDFAGLKFFMSRDQKVSGQVFQRIIYSNIELNVPIDEKVFDK